MTMNAPGYEHLSDAELESALRALDRIKNADALTLEGVDVLFCALIASLESVSPSEYLPVILGGDPGSSQMFADLEMRMPQCRVDAVLELDHRGF